MAVRPPRLLCVLVAVPLVAGAQELAPDRAESYVERFLAGAESLAAQSYGAGALIGGCAPQFWGAWAWG